MSKIQDWIISKIFIDGFKHIEKQNFMLKALEACYKKKEIKSVWQAFLNSVDGLLQDARDEVQMSREWNKK